MQAVADGYLKRLILQAYPRSGKSHLISELFLGYYFRRRQDKTIGLTGYSDSLVSGFSRKAREFYKEAGGVIRVDASSVKDWMSPEMGTVWARGADGQITGKGGDVLIVDDIFKNPQEASSTLIRMRRIDFLFGTLFDRQEPDGAIILSQHRWHKKDVLAEVEKREAQSPENWLIIDRQAIKAPTSNKYPSTYRVVSDTLKGGDFEGNEQRINGHNVKTILKTEVAKNREGEIIKSDYLAHRYDFGKFHIDTPLRRNGEALIPQRHTEAELNQFRTKDAYFWSVKFQQEPIYMSGRVFHKFSQDNVVTEIPKGRLTYKFSIDFGGNNEVVGIWAKDPLGVWTLVKILELPQKTTEERAKIIIASCPGPVRRGHGGAGSESQTRREYKARGLFMPEPTITGYAEQINRTNEMFDNGKLKILEELEEIIQDFDDCIYDSEGNVINQNSWHALDMARYFANGEIREGQGGQTAPKPSRYDRR